jgi:hypothetical protein
LLDSEFAGSIPAKDNGFLRAIKIHSMTSFRGEGKPSAPCLKILQHVGRFLLSVTEIFCWLNYRIFLAKFLCALLLGVSAGTCHRALVDKLRMIRNQMGTHSSSENGCSGWDALYDTPL